MAGEEVGATSRGVAGAGVARGEHEDGDAAGGLAHAVAGREELRTVLQSTGLVCFACGIGLAVVKHHLYDVDLVISRGLIYVALVGVSTLLYIVMVVGIGSLVGGTTRSNLVLSVTATAVIAVLFHPVQRAVEQAANRLVFGRTRTPYETLTSFTRHLAGENLTGNLVQQMADSVADASVPRLLASTRSTTRRPRSRRHLRVCAYRRGHPSTRWR